MISIPKGIQTLVQLFVQATITSLVNWMLAPVIILLAYALVCPATAVTRSATAQLLAQQRLEYLKSWIKDHLTPSNLKWINNTLHGRTPYQDMSFIQHLRTRWRYKQQSRLQKEVARLTYRRRCRRRTKGRRAALALTFAMAFFSLVCAAKPTPEVDTAMNLMPSIIAMQSEGSASSSRVAVWDTDSKPVGLDSRASACISDDERDFVPGTLKPISRRIKVFGGYMTTQMQVGTLKWTWNDDQGLPYTFEIPNSYCIPKGGVKLISPQHWAQHVEGGAETTTVADTTTMKWNQGQCQLSIPHDKSTNVATIHLSPGYSDYCQFVMEAELTDDKPVPLEEDLPVVTDDELSIASDDIHPDKDEEDPWITDWHYDLTQEELTDEPTTDPEGAIDSEGASPRLFDLTTEDSITTERLLATDEEEEKQSNSPIHHWSY